MGSDLTESSLPSGGQTMSEWNKGRGEKGEDKEWKKWLSVIDGPARPTQGSGQQADESKGGLPVGGGVGEVQWMLWPFPGLGTGC